MTEVFLYIANMSITAGILAVVVLLLRLFLKKAPKWVSVLLWGLVALRLICPFAVESPFSLMPRTDWIEQETLTEEDLFLNSVPDSMESIDLSSFGQDVTVHYDLIENPNIEIHRGGSTSFLLSCVWLAGMAVLLLHTLISTVRLRRSIGTAIRVRDNIWGSSAVESPFVLGLIHPRIYVPRGMGEDKLAYVIAHEQAHIRRRDHWWKPLGFLLLTIHWFNPVMWLSYILLCRDIEMACDEKVVRDMCETERADYSEALLECSVKRSAMHSTRIAACPLAFGEVGVKERIKSVLNYKKPAFWVVVLAVIASIVTAVCFLTDPSSVDADLQIFIDGRIAEHHQSPYASEHACVLDWELLGKEKNGDEITLYMWVLYEEYSMEDGALQIKTTAHIPTVITAKNVSGGYRLVEYWEPGDGSDYARDIRNKVPWYLYVSMIDSQSYISKQKAACERLAKEYFESSPESLKKLTLDDVIALSAKGTDLTWEDFAEYWFIETGSGLYIRVYEIDETFSLWIGGGSPVGTPMYIRLKCNDVDVYADVTTDDIAAFIEKHTKEGPILYDRPLNYYIDLAWEEAEPIADAKVYVVQKSDVTITHDNDGTVTIIFNGIDRNGGWSEIHVTLVPQSDGGYGVDSSLTTATSHSELLDEEKAAIVKAQVQSKILNLFIVIESSPTYSSNPQDYIHAHPDEFNDLVAYGYETLEFIFKEFLAGGKTRLHGHILRTVMMNLLRDNEIIAYDAVNGQDYFDQWLKSARSVGQQHDSVWLEVNAPAIALVLRMTGDISAETEVDLTEMDPDPVETAISRAVNQHYRDDEPTGLLHGISYIVLGAEELSGTPLFGKDNHIRKESYYLLVMHQKYTMQNGEPTAIGGSYVPTVLTFTKEDNGEYILDEYWEPRDGSYYDEDIKAKFPESLLNEVWNMDSYSEDLKKQCDDNVFVYIDFYRSDSEPSDYQ